MSPDELRSVEDLAQQCAPLVADEEASVQEQLTHARSEVIRLQQKVDELGRAHAREIGISQQELRASEARWAFALDAAGIIAWDLDIKSDMVTVRRVAGEYLRLPLSDFEKRIHPDDIGRIRATRSQALNQKTDHRVEFRMLRPDGSPGWFLSTGRGAYDASGAPTTFSGVVLDITQRRQVEEQVRESLEKLKETEEQLRLFIEYTPAPVAMFDREMRYLITSQRWLVDYELGRKSVIGLCHYDVFPDMPERWKESHRRCLAGETVHCSEDEYFRGNKTDWIRWELRPWRKSGGEIGGLVIFSEIITESVLARKRIENLCAELQNSSERLLRSNAELEQFAYVASHDLKEPLRVVSNFVQLLALRYRGKLGGEADTYIKFVTDGARKMHALIDDLLHFSRVGRESEEFQPTNLNEIVLSVVTDLTLQISECRGEVTWSNLPTIPAHPGQLTHLFMNLINNALKYRSQLPPRIEIDAKLLGEEWLFSIKDNGIGIDKQYWDRIFIIFQRLHNQREYSGTGIGLAVCKRIVLHHGGQIWVESVLNEGSSFFFTIPAAKENPQSTKIPDTGRPAGV